jgi:S1-C subfamily serine protease
MEKELRLEQIERYLFGEMSPEEMGAFEIELQQDPALLAFTEQHARVLEQMDFYFSRKKLKDTLKEISNENRVPVVSMVPPAAKETRSKLHYRTVWVAAATAVLISGLSVSIFSYYNSKLKNSAYKALRRDMENMRSSQNRLIAGITVGKKTAQDVNLYGGTGFAIGENGYVATSFHVIKGGDSIFVEMHDGNRYRASVIGSYPGSDLAILQINDSTFVPWKKLPYSLRNAPSLLGEKVFTLGYPRDEIVYGEGTISSQSGYNGDTLSYQLSIPVNPGNSGGPVLDEKGNVIGMISGKQTETDATAFAMRSSLLLRSIEELNNDTTHEAIRLRKTSSAAGMSRTSQISKIKEYVVNIRVYN